jgi:hypothetical protein
MRLHTAICALLPLLLAAAACSDGGGGAVPEGQAATIRAEVERAMRDAYDLSKPDVATRMLSLYPSAGRIVSASGGRVMSSRDSLESGIRYFWESVGVNMRDPKWVWESFYIDVLSPTAAVATATYRIPHRNPRNEPHVLGGAMTAVFSKRDGRWVIIQEHLSDTPSQPDSSASNATHDHH